MTKCSNVPRTPLFPLRIGAIQAFEFFDMTSFALLKSSMLYFFSSVSSTFQRKFVASKISYQMCRCCSATWWLFTVIRDFCIVMSGQACAIPVMRRSPIWGLHNQEKAFRGGRAWISILASCPNSAHRAISMPKKSMPILYHTTHTIWCPSKACP